MKMTLKQHIERAAAKRGLKVQTIACKFNTEKYCIESDNLFDLQAIQNELLAKKSIRIYSEYVKNYSVLVVMDKLKFDAIQMMLNYIGEVIDSYWIELHKCLQAGMTRDDAMFYAKIAQNRRIDDDLTDRHNQNKAALCLHYGYISRNEV